MLCEESPNVAQRVITINASKIRHSSAMSRSSQYPYIDVIGLVAFSFFTGIAIGYSTSKLMKYEKSDSQPTVYIPCDDNCLSLYYGKNIFPDGRGFPYVRTIDPSTIKALRSIHPEYRKIPTDIYKAVVENMVIVCVDIVCQRKSDNKILLFYRRDAPASNIWWWPGGFYDTAESSDVPY